MDSTVNLNGLSVLKFYSDTCTPCKKMSPIIKKMEEEFPRVKIYNINIEDEYKLAKKFSILSVPTLIFLNGERENTRIVGMANTDSVRKAFQNLAG